MKRWLFLLLLTTTLAAADNSVSAPEAADGWLLLFDGDSLFGWTPQAGGRWTTNAGVLTATSDSGYLQSNSAFSDFWLKFDYISARADADCAVYLRAAATGDPPETGYALEIGDAKSDWPAGSIVDHFKADAVHPAVNQWHTVEAMLEADHITVKLDGKQVVDGKNPRSRGGVISLACSQPGRMQFRNLKLKPLAMKALFNGTDLSGWKAVSPPPPKKEGLKKVIPIGGGKPKEAKWSVAQGAIHAEGGEGQLESTAMYDDFVVQMQIRLNSKKGDHPKGGVFFRGDAGQFFSGYDVAAFNEVKEGKHALADNTGGLKGLQPPRKASGADNQFFLETIAARGRHVEVWIDGYPVTDFQDTRAEGTAPQKAARTAAGTISLQSVDDKSNLDFRGIQIAQLPKTLGKGPAEATAIPPPPAAIPAPTPAPGASAAPQIVFPPPDPNKPKVQQLMSQALGSNDPQQQKAIYGQILQLDPSNPMAANGYQQAQQKIDAANQARTQQETQQQQQEQIDTQSQAQAKTALQAAQGEFLAGNLDAAHTHIGVANKLVSTQAPEDPLRGAVMQLRDRIESAIQARTRLRMIWGTVGIAFVLSLIAAWWARRGAKYPYLEVINGLEKGKKFNLDQEVMHIGAVPEDGGNKNEIVVQDLERSISRFHCEIHQRTGQFFLIDCGSANGTRLDGHSIPAGKPFRIKSGARIELAGNCALRLGFEKRAAQ